MSVSSPCEICLLAEVEYTCSRCGQLVCEDHYDKTLGLCVECAGKVGDSPDDRIPSEDDLPDGVDIYRS